MMSGRNANPQSSTMMGMAMINIACHFSHVCALNVSRETLDRNAAPVTTVPVEFAEALPAKLADIVIRRKGNVHVVLTSVTVMVLNVQVLLCRAGLVFQNSERMKQDPDYEVKRCRLTNSAECEKNQECFTGMCYRYGEETKSYCAWQLGEMCPYARSGNRQCTTRYCDSFSDNGLDDKFCVLPRLAECDPESSVYPQCPKDMRCLKPSGHTKYVCA